MLLNTLSTNFRSFEIQIIYKSKTTLLSQKYLPKFQQKKRQFLYRNNDIKEGRRCNQTQYSKGQQKNILLPGRLVGMREAFEAYRSSKNI